MDRRVKLSQIGLIGTALIGGWLVWLLSDQKSSNTRAKPEVDIAKLEASFQQLDAETAWSEKGLLSSRALVQLRPEVSRSEVISLLRETLSNPRLGSAEPPHGLRARDMWALAYATLTDRKLLISDSLPVVERERRIEQMLRL